MDSEEYSVFGKTAAPQEKQKKTRKKRKKRIRCQECLKTFACKQSFREHLFYHSNIKTHKCPQCSQSFRYGSQLSAHKKQHLASKSMSWPKLTDLMRNHRQESKTSVILTEKVRLPKIQVQIIKELPSFSSLFNVNH